MILERNGMKKPLTNSSTGVLCAESQQWIEIAESLGQEKFAPRTKMIDEESRFPAENYQELAGERDIAPQHAAEAV